MVRTLYDDSLRLDPALVDGLYATVADRYPSLEVRVLTDRPDLFRLGKLQETADRTVFERTAFMRELGDWLVANDDQERPHAMRGREFGFDDVFAAGLSRGLRQEGRLLPDQVVALARPTVVFRVGTPKCLDDGARPHSARPALDQVVLPTALGPVDGRPCR